MPKAYRDSSIKRNALRNEISSIDLKGSALQQSNNLVYQQDRKKIEDRYAEISRDSIELSRESLRTNTMLRLTEIGLNTASQIYGIVRQDQMEKANKENAGALEIGQRILQASLASGTTYFDETVDEQGNRSSKLVLSQEFLDWADSYRESIGNGKGMKSVRNLQLDSFNAGYENLVTKGFGIAIEKSYADLNANFTQTLQSNLRNDIASYVASGGDVDAWNANFPISGVATIAGRSDWSAKKIQTKTDEYLMDVMKKGDVEIAANIARTQGLEASHNWLYSPARSYMLEDEKQDAYTIAAKAVADRSASISTDAGLYMESALVDPESTMSASDVYSALEEKYAEEAPEVREAARKSATAKHKEIITIAGNNRLSLDRSEGLASMKQTYEDLLAGKFDGYFVNNEGVKNALIKSYASDISEMEKQMAQETSTSVTKIRTANKNTVADYTASKKAIKDQFDAGTIKGKDAIFQLTANADYFKFQLQGDEVDVAFYENQIDSIGDSFISELVSQYIPTKYQQSVKDGFSTLTWTIGLDKAESKMSDDEKKALGAYKEYYYGYIADYIYENGASASLEEMQDFCKDLGQKIAVSYKDDTWKKIYGGSAIDGFTAKEKLDQFSRTNNIVWQSDSSQYFLYDQNSEADRKNIQSDDPLALYSPAYRFASQGVENTFNEMAAEVATQVGYYTGRPSAPIMSTMRPGRDDNGNPILSPVVTCDGTDYRIRNGYIEEYRVEDGKGSWVSTGVEPATTKLEMDKARGIAKQEADVTGQSSTTISRQGEQYRKMGASGDSTPQNGSQGSTYSVPSSTVSAKVSALNGRKGSVSSKLKSIDSPEVLEAYYGQLGDRDREKNSALYSELLEKLKKKAR